MFLLILDDRSLSYDAKQVHCNNLKKIVDYCENILDCRRSLQLNYFAEHFTREQCLSNKESACDNCLKKGAYKVGFIFYYIYFHLIYGFG